MAVQGSKRRQLVAGDIEHFDGAIRGCSCQLSTIVVELYIVHCVGMACVLRAYRGCHADWPTCPAELHDAADSMCCVNPWADRVCQAQSLKVGNAAWNLLN